MDGAKKMGNQYEVSLEARELYLIIAGLLLFAILVFILGVFVGRRIERSQTHPVAAADLAAPSGEKAEGEDLAGGPGAGSPGAYPAGESEAALPPNPSAEKNAANAPGKTAAGKDNVQYTYYDSLVKGKGVGIQAQPEGQPGVQPGVQPGSQPESEPQQVAPAAPEETEPAAPAPKAQKKAKKATAKAAPAKVAMKKATSADAEEGKYTIQISSFLERDQAQNLVRWLRERKYPAYLATAEITGKGTWHRVRVGKFATKEIAARYQKELENQIHLRGFVAQVD
ncbi:MAG: SPOR domain-containing protein [bacterium]|nr:SPOR domain-containing protein [bacterium]